MNKRAKIIAVDFDGTLVENKWPEIGAVNVEVLNYCKNEQAKGARIILWTIRTDEPLANAVKWCEENGLRLDAVNDNLKEMVDFFGSNTRKIFADEFIDDRTVQGFSLPYTAEPSWAEREVSLACAKEREMSDAPGEEGYGIACYKSALRAFRCLMDDGHTGYSLGITKGILNRLISGKCLSPIEEIPEIWEEVHIREDNIKRYQCKRMGSLFKEVAPDGTTTYSDVNRVQVVNVDEPEIAYQNGFVTRLIDKIFPIAMPYFPSEKKFKVVRDEFMTDPKSKDFDTVGYLYVITPNGEKVALNGYFKYEDGKPDMVRIDEVEYEERKTRRVEKK